MTVFKIRLYRIVVRSMKDPIFESYGYSTCKIETFS